MNGSSQLLSTEFSEAFIPLWDRQCQLPPLRTFNALLAHLKYNAHPRLEFAFDYLPTVHILYSHDLKLTVLHVTVVAPSATCLIPPMLSDII